MEGDDDNKKYARLLRAMQNEGIDDQTIQDMIDRGLIGRDLRVDRLPMHPGFGGQENLVYQPNVELIGNNMNRRYQHMFQPFGNNQDIINMSDAELRGHQIGMNELSRLSRNDLLYMARGRVIDPAYYSKGGLIDKLLEYLYG